MPHNTPGITAYIGLGANIGDRELNLMQALRALDRAEGVRVIRCSSIYETDPVGYPDQPVFLNMCAAVSTSLSPRELLALCLDIERLMGRTREIRWGPRTIDLDLLLYDDVVLSSPELTLPHPRIAERLFVLKPLMEVLSRTDRRFACYARAVETMEGKDGVRLWKQINWRNGSGHFAN
jgi:2-amino-4-hydroxy-6-hydroxymethyldihydropteridine diphosphokinase